MHPNWFRIGGVAADLTTGWEKLVKDFVDYMPARMRDYDKLVMQNIIFKGRTVGVGTVVSAEQVRECAAAGARFVVSPGLIPEVIGTAQELGLEAVPGVFTATELLAATAAGARVMKLFPASCGGPSYLRALRGPFPTTALVPTGGVRLDEIVAYFDAGATVVALGSALVGRSAPRTDNELELIAAQAARATDVARQAVLPAAAADRSGSTS